jgi:hypothetical protein
MMTIKRLMMAGSKGFGALSKRQYIDNGRSGGKNEPLNGI